MSPRYRVTLTEEERKGLDQLREAIEAFIEVYNQDAKPFLWRKREVKGKSTQKYYR